MSKTFNIVKSILSEARQSQSHPLEGHDYHRKTNEQLKFIIKDAGEAAKAMKTHGTPQGDAAEAKYLDQVNDASTVLHFRKKTGTPPNWYIQKYFTKEKVNEDIESLNELHKETLQSYIKKADIEAKRLDVEAAKEKDPIKKLKKITKASKRGLGAFKAHLKVRKMEESLELHDRNIKKFFNSDDASAEELNKLSDHEDSHIRMAVAKHKNTPQSALTKLASDKSHDVKLGVASNPNTHHDTLHDLSSSTSAYTRAAVASNPNTRKDTLKGLSNDRNDFVSDAVKKRKF